MALLPPKQDAVQRIFARPKPVIGVVHLLPLPGAPRYDGTHVERIYERAVADVSALEAGGVDGVIVENAADLPFVPPHLVSHETVAALAAACLRVRDATDLPIGVICVANAVAQAQGLRKVVMGRW